MSKANGRKSILVTGAASGIGAETARYFAARDWFVGLFDIDEDGLAERAEEIGADNCIAGRLDVRDRAAWKMAMGTFASATDGKMNVLFNNAGIGRFGWFEDISPEDSDAIVDVNIKGVINGAYAALPLLKTTEDARIVNVASTAGFVAAPQLAVYVASKFAVRGLTESLDVELSPLGIRVTSLAPWFVDTPILDIARKEGANEKMSDTLAESGTTVYPVALAAEGAWQAAHGKKQHYGVGKHADRARLMARLVPGFMRRQIDKAVPPRE